ncbi:tRNA-specific 2-thiouridylase, partial [Tribonema minus]
MSGGVDSSVTAYLLKQQGYDVVAVHMRNWDRSDEEGREACTADADWADVQRVCRQLQIPCHSVNFSKEYWHDVFAPSLDVFSQGNTPNPDALCNARIKFGAFRAHALATHGAALFATGHYAQLFHPPPQQGPPPRLRAAVDPIKDQSYFLATVPWEALRGVIFPLGGMMKGEVRELAARAGLVTAAKKDSVGICFVGQRRSFGGFLSQYITPTPGDFVCGQTGARLGPHEGVELYTLGQKARIANMAAKWFVCAKRQRSGDVVVVPGTEHPALMCGALTADAAAFAWGAGAAPRALAEGRAMRVQYKVRYRSGRETGTVRLRGGLLHLEFDKPERAITPHQLLALYGGPEFDICLGGGPIL